MEKNCNISQHEFRSEKGNINEKRKLNLLQKHRAQSSAPMFLFFSLSPPPQAMRESRPRPHAEVPDPDSPTSTAYPQGFPHQPIASETRDRPEQRWPGRPPGGHIDPNARRTRRDSKGRVATARSGAWNRAAAAAMVAATATPAGAAGCSRESWNAWLKS